MPTFNHRLVFLCFAWLTPTMSAFDTGKKQIHRAKPPSVPKPLQYRRHLDEEVAGDTSFDLITYSSNFRRSLSHEVSAPLSIGGADMVAYCKGHVSRTEDFDPVRLPVTSLPHDFPTGTYFKNGPGGYQSDDGLQYMHPFDCNGKVLAVTLDSEHQEAVCRYKHVQTPKYKQDAKSGTMSERGFFGTNKQGGFLGNLFQGMNPKNPANTAVVLSDDHQRLYALWEAGRPFAMDPKTLETHGEEDFDGILDDQTSFSAHPAYDPKRKTYTNFCISRPKNASEILLVGFREFDSTSFESISPGLQIQLPGLVTTHDIVVSENYIIFHWNEAQVNGSNAIKALLGLIPPFALVEHVPTDITRYILIPRDLLESGDVIDNVFSDPRIQIAETPFHLAVHFTNAYERQARDESNRLVFEATCWKGHGYGVDEMVQTRKPMWEAIDFDVTPPTQLEQFEIDLDSTTLVRMDTIANEAIEFTAIPREQLTSPHNIVYSLGAHKKHFHHNSKAAMSPMGSVRKINLTTKDQDVFSFAPHESVQDGDVVRKLGADPGDEDAVYFVTVVTNGRDMVSDLVVLDGEDIQAGPVTRVRLPEIVPNNGIHGQFYAGPNPFATILQ